MYMKCVDREKLINKKLFFLINYNIFFFTKSDTIKKIEV
jgi:hypothetical protein